jgi:hypothetical protein
VGFHACTPAAGSGLRLAATYFPGVHPSGPFHRGLSLPVAVRVAQTAAAWEAFSPGAPPQLVVVASCLWDVARMAAHEPALLAGPALSADTLDGWSRNLTAALGAVRAAFPAARGFALHTTLPPRVGEGTTGAAKVPYLGRRYHVEQLNAAAAWCAAAAHHGLALLDYAAIGGGPLADGGAQLQDDIHPSAPVCLEAANLALNLAADAEACAGGGGGGRRLLLPPPQQQQRAAPD